MLTGVGAAILDKTLLAATSALLAAILATAAHRDVRGGWFAPRAGRAPRLRLLGSIPAFALRRLLRPHWTASAGMLITAGALAAVGAIGYHHRDLRT